jgi:hypothetical protein
MRLKLFLVTALVLVSLSAPHVLRDAGGVGSAQVTTPGDDEPPRPAIIEVTDDQLERAYAEADSIHRKIRAAIRNKKRNYKLESERHSHLTSGFNVENKGKTNNQVSWLNRNTSITLTIKLGHYHDETMYWYGFGLNGISMGEFFDVPGIGEKAVLVKNVRFNRKVTTAGIHFVKGRAWVSLYVNNWRRSTEKNEKELMELVRIIEPLVIARADIRDP